MPTATAEISLESIERVLLDERERNKSRIPYMFTCCTKLPGKFMLSYMIKLHLRNEYIKVTQEGFKFREKLFASFNELVAWFKIHFNDPLPVPVMPQPAPPSQNNNHNISSQMSGMRLTPQHQSQYSASSSHSMPHRTPNYPPPPSSRTPQQTNNYNNNSSTVFDSIINNESQPAPAEYSTSSYDNNNSYLGPNTNTASSKYNDFRSSNFGNGRGGKSKFFLFINLIKLFRTKSSLKK
jgi:hypothetical protein